MILKRTADLITGCAAIGLGGIVMSQAVYRRAGAPERVDPRTIPVVVAGLIIACGVGLVIAAWRSRSTATLEWIGRKGAVRVGASVMACAGYIVLLQLFGFAVATTVFAGLMSWALDRSAVGRAILGGLLTGVGGSVVFLALLHVQLPVGPLDQLLIALVGG